MAGTLFFAAMLFYGWSVGSGLDRSGAPRNLTAKAILPESRGPSVPGPYKYCDFVGNFFGSFFAKKEQTPVKNPNPASAPR